MKDLNIKTSIPNFKLNLLKQFQNKKQIDYLKTEDNKTQLPEQAIDSNNDNQPNYYNYKYFLTEEEFKYKQYLKRYSSINKYTLNKPLKTEISNTKKPKLNFINKDDYITKYIDLQETQMIRQKAKEIKHRQELIKKELIDKQYKKESIGIKTLSEIKKNNGKEKKYSLKENQYIDNLIKNLPDYNNINITYRLTKNLYSKIDKTIFNQKSKMSKITYDFDKVDRVIRSQVLKINS